jgi:hypothetical protein
LFAGEIPFCNRQFRNLLAAFASSIERTSAIFSASRIARMKAWMHSSEDRERAELTLRRDGSAVPIGIFALPVREPSYRNQPAPKESAKRHRCGFTPRSDVSRGLAHAR